MIDVTHKRPTLRIARAEARLHCAPATIEAIRTNNVPKGDVLESSRSVGLLAVKQVPALLPHCHPIPIDGAEVLFEIVHDEIRVEVEIKAIARTGVEVEAMTAASLAALNMYDMLKPIDKQIVLREVQLLRKRGGKSDYRETFAAPPTAGVLVVSDSVAAGRKEDRAGRAASDRLTAEAFDVRAYEVVPDEPDRIATHVRQWVDALKLDFVLTVGGTGLGPRDQTVETVRPLLDREIPGIAETMRAFGMDRTPYAALSRGIAGQRRTSLVITLPGSTGGARESMDALLPWVAHIFKVFEHAYRHEDPQ